MRKFLLILVALTFSTADIYLPRGEKIVCLATSAKTLECLEFGTQLKEFRFQEQRILNINHGTTAKAVPDSKLSPREKRTTHNHDPPFAGLLFAIIIIRFKFAFAT